MISIADGIGLLIGIVVIATIADRVRIAYPILLVIAGIGVALIPVHHRVELDPDLVLLVFLPPLIYDASLDTSARELRTTFPRPLPGRGVWCWSPWWRWPWSSTRWSAA